VFGVDPGQEALGRIVQGAAIRRDTRESGLLGPGGVPASRVTQAIQDAELHNLAFNTPQDLDNIGSIKAARELLGEREAQAAEVATERAKAAGTRTGTSGGTKKELTDFEKAIKLGDEARAQRDENREIDATNRAKQLHIAEMQNQRQQLQAGAQAIINETRQNALDAWFPTEGFEDDDKTVNTNLRKKARADRFIRSTDFGGTKAQGALAAEQVLDGPAYHALLDASALAAAIPEAYDEDTWNLPFLGGGAAMPTNMSELLSTFRGIDGSFFSAGLNIDLRAGRRINDIDIQSLGRDARTFMRLIKMEPNMRDAAMASSPKEYVKLLARFRKNMTPRELKQVRALAAQAQFNLDEYLSSPEASESDASLEEGFNRTPDDAIFAVPLAGAFDTQRQAQLGVV
jgi:hypothetical protein